MGELDTALLQKKDKLELVFKCQIRFAAYRAAETSPIKGSGGVNWIVQTVTHLNRLYKQPLQKLYLGE